MNIPDQIKVQFEGKGPEIGAGETFFSYWAGGLLAYGDGTAEQLEAAIETGLLDDATSLEVNRSSCLTSLPPNMWESAMRSFDLRAGR